VLAQKSKTSKKLLKKKLKWSCKKGCLLGCPKMDVKITFLFSNTPCLVISLRTKISIQKFIFYCVNNCVNSNI
jgi:hypothetical protein